MSSYPVDKSPTVTATEFAGSGKEEATIQHHDATPQQVKPDQLDGDSLHTLSPEERTALVLMANDADTGPDVFSVRYLKFVLTCLVVILNSGDNGFDGTVMGAVNSMTQFHDYFGFGAATTGTSIVFGIYTIGQICAFLPNIYLPDKVGRRWAMFLANILQCTGAIITANATNNHMFFFGRWLTGFGCTAANTAAKSYIAEITAPKSRGRWMGVLNSFFYVGQILAAGISIPFGRIQAGINLLFVLFIAESPRWLYARGKKEQAARVLARFHSRQNDTNSPLIRLEMQEFEEGISVSGTDREFWNFRTLVDTFGARYRLGLCFLVSVWGQLSGNGLITCIFASQAVLTVDFLPVLLGQAGISDPNRQRELNLVNAGTSMVGALTGSAIVDHIGRRKLMLIAAVCCFCGMIIAGGLLSPAGDQNVTRANTGIAFIFLFMVFFSFGWTPLQALYPAEVLSYENRAKGLAVQGIATNAVSTINTFGLPPALGTIGYINYFIFAAWDVVGIILIWLFVVETKQLTLEEVDEVFQSRNPKQKSFKMAAEARERARARKSGLAGV